MSESDGEVGTPGDGPVNPPSENPDERQFLQQLEKNTTMMENMNHRSVK
jgi:hypothetical protein